MLLEIGLNQLLQLSYSSFWDCVTTTEDSS